MANPNQTPSKEITREVTAKENLGNTPRGNAFNVEYTIGQTKPSASETKGK